MLLAPHCRIRTCFSLSLDSHGISTGAVMAWPIASAMFEDAFDLSVERRVKYLWRLGLTRQARRNLLPELKGLTLGEALFRAQPRAFYPLQPDAAIGRSRSRGTASRRRGGWRSVPFGLC